MITGYEVLKFLHVLMAIVAVGFNASYAIWLRRAARTPEHQSFALRGVKILDDRFANPAYGVLLVTGLVMVLTTPGLHLTTFWVLVALILYTTTVILAAGVYTPTLRRQIEALEAEGPGSARYRALAKRQAISGVVLGIIVVVIVFLMVTKPTL
ncbi:MAG TPA: DUF2269 family protein [Actinomycetota bacterium]|nr:DUF2269 family protein [Actinomycetota bacterium]